MKFLVTLLAIASLGLWLSLATPRVETRPPTGVRSTTNECSEALELDTSSEAPTPDAAPFSMSTPGRRRRFPDAGDYVARYCERFDTRVELTAPELRALQQLIDDLNAHWQVLLEEEAQLVARLSIERMHRGLGRILAETEGQHPDPNADYVHVTRHEGRRVVVESVEGLVP